MLSSKFTTPLRRKSLNTTARDTSSDDHNCSQETLREQLLPTRVLKIIDLEVVYLHVPSNKEKARYACLGYCWGADNPVKLISSTFHQYKVGIARSSLPRTFQDAINVNYQLVLKYIWIDSMCTVQSDRREIGVTKAAGWQRSTCKHL